MEWDREKVRINLIKWAKHGMSFGDCLNIFKHIYIYLFWTYLNLNITYNWMTWLPWKTHSIQGQKGTLQQPGLRSQRRGHGRRGSRRSAISTWFSFGTWDLGPGWGTWDGTTNWDGILNWDINNGILFDHLASKCQWCFAFCVLQVAD